MTGVYVLFGSADRALLAMVAAYVVLWVVLTLRAAR